MKLLSVCTLAAMLVPVATAQHPTFTVNPEASQVSITLKTTHELVKGVFHIQSGSIQFDPGDHKMSGSVVVLAGSGKTGNESRDKRMTKEILKVEQYTTVSFAPKSYTGTIAPTGDSSIQVNGIFTLVGNPHEMSIPMRIHTEGSKTTATTQFIIPYVQWGLKNPSFMFWKAENDVVIDLDIVGQVSN